MFNLNLDACIGEFGIVYKARLIKDQKMPQLVAVKTLKGIVETTIILLHIHVMHNLASWNMHNLFSPWICDEHSHAAQHILPAGLFTSNDVQGMMNEILKMQFFDHPRVMCLVGVCFDAGPGVSIIMPYMANGSILGYLKKDRDNLVLKKGANPNTVTSCTI